MKERGRKFGDWGFIMVPKRELILFLSPVFRDEPVILSTVYYAEQQMNYGGF
jgi:hypothetical protein